jgi:hypothetical protein
MNNATKVVIKIKKMELEEVFAKILEARARHKASLKGIDLMKYNLFWKLRGWMMREDGYRCVTVGEIVEKVQKYAPKTILKHREAFIDVVNNLWSATHGYSIDSEDYLREDLEYKLSFVYK